MVKSRLQLLALSFVMVGAVVIPCQSSAQTLLQLIDGAKKEGQLILSWGEVSKNANEHSRIRQKFQKILAGN